MLELTVHRINIICMSGREEIALFVGPDKIQNDI